MADKIGESKYALKRAQRAGGRSYKSLGEGPAAAEWNPAPRPLDYDYIPKHAPKIGIRAFESNGPMKHENVNLLKKFFGEYRGKPAPRRKKDITIKYNHFDMNYHGWNS